MKLQQILGVDKTNPVFTICRNHETKKLHVYFGAELLEVVPDDRESPEYKILSGTLCNSGVRAKKLCTTFDVSFKTLQSWGAAIRSGDPELLVRVLAGRQWKRKLTTEITRFIQLRFPHIYAGNRRSYSKEIRSEILEIFEVKLCSETIRPILKALKNGDPVVKCTDEELETTCELVSRTTPTETVANSFLAENAEENSNSDLQSNRKWSPILMENMGETSSFCHHAGVLLFHDALTKIARIEHEHAWIMKQWLASILLGSVNVEQSKTLDVEGLEGLLGRCLRTCRRQRLLLDDLAKDEVVPKLLSMNAESLCTQNNDFFYDPHSKQYTGELKILKGWCGSKHRPDKALHMDFIHASSGSPVFISYDDNFCDLRERFESVVSDFRKSVPIYCNETLSFIIDRGIYSQAVFKEISKDPKLKIVTWEKGYKTADWVEDEGSGAFTIERPRNNAQDVKVYHFKYIDEPWPKDVNMRRIRVQATNPNGRCIELAILTNDLTRDAQELITLMFTRWLQENDFKYLNVHYGINQLTSYASEPYAGLRDCIDDKQMKSGEYKALQKQKSVISKKLKNALLSEHCSKAKNKKRTIKIEDLSLQLDEINTQIGTTQKEVSRLETLIDGGYQKLNTQKKSVMDAIKIFARNSFYELLQPFKESYNNYRDDHTYFRNLTHAPGIIQETDKNVHVKLFPTAYHPKSLRSIFNIILDDINAANPIMPDGTGRTLHFSIANSMGIEIATTHTQIQAMY